MQENLLGYLLGALDSPEHDEIQRRLDDDPQLRRQLSEWESRLAPLEAERWQHEPPLNLAASTCQLVAEQAAAVTSRRSRPSQSMSEWNPRKHGWDMIDAVVAAGIFLAAAMLFFPAIANSRYQAQQLACQNKLRLSSMALAMFAERNNGVLPYIPTAGKTGVAGFYAPQLMDGGYLTEHAAFLCPSSALAARSRQQLLIPSIEQIRNATGQQLAQLQQTMGGSFMYNLGYFQGRRHRATTNRGRSYFPVMADSFEMQGSGNAMVSAHGGKGINVAFEGGNVHFIVRITRQHPFFVSDRGLVEAGSNVEDAVLGHSSQRPLPVQFDGESPEAEPPGELKLGAPELWQDVQEASLSFSSTSSPNK